MREERKPRLFPVIEFGAEITMQKATTCDVAFCVISYEDFFGKQNPLITYVDMEDVAASLPGSLSARP